MSAVRANKPFADASVAAVFERYPGSVRTRLLELRSLVFDTAKRTPGVGKIEEVLKWGQPSYLTSETRSGSTIRIDAIRGQPERYAMYFHCQTNLIASFKARFGDAFRYEGNRALVFSVNAEIPRTELETCVALALTYHLQKAGRRPTSIGRLISQSRRSLR